MAARWLREHWIVAAVVAVVGFLAALVTILAYFGIQPERNRREPRPGDRIVAQRAALVNLQREFRKNCVRLAVITRKRCDDIRMVGAGASATRCTELRVLEDEAAERVIENNYVDRIPDRNLRAGLRRAIQHTTAFNQDVRERRCGVVYRKADSLKTELGIASYTIGDDWRRLTPPPLLPQIDLGSRRNALVALQREIEGNARTLRVSRHRPCADVSELATDAASRAAGYIDTVDEEGIDVYAVDRALNHTSEFNAFVVESACLDVAGRATRLQKELPMIASLFDIYQR